MSGNPDVDEVIRYNREAAHDILTCRACSVDMCRNPRAVGTFQSMKQAFMRGCMEALRNQEGKGAK